MAGSLTYGFGPWRCVAVWCALACLCTGCFTGVESTKTISLSRSEMRRTAPTAEDTLMSRVGAVPLSQWKRGRTFFVTDPRLSMMLVQRTVPADSADRPHRGDLLQYDGTSMEHHPDGTKTLSVALSDGDKRYLYDTGLDSLVAQDGFYSSSMEGVVDVECVHALDRLLHDRRLWTRSRLWYDQNGHPDEGRKYVPVTVSAVTPGDMVYPLRIYFTDDSGCTGCYMMSLPGASPGTSRRFQSLFTLTDPRSMHQHIEPEVWALIQAGKVRVGMTKDECRLSWGEPDDSDSGRNYTSTLDVWKYDGGRYLMFENGLLSEFRQ